MTIFLDKIDAAPIIGNNFSYPLAQWIAVLVDTLNEVIGDIENALNFLQAQSYTSAEISILFSGGMLVNGVILYDTNLNVYVGMISGALVKFSTTAYP